MMRTGIDAAHVGTRLIVRCSGATDRQRRRASGRLRLRVGMWADEEHAPFSGEGQGRRGRAAEAVLLRALQLARQDPALCPTARALGHKA